MMMISRKLRNARGRVEAFLTGRRKEIIQHSMGIRKPRIEFLIVPDKSPDQSDVNNCERILAAYKRASSEHADSQDSLDIWTDIKQHQPSLLGVLEKGDPVLLASYLCNMSRHDATHGTVQGNVEHKRISSDGSYARFIALQIKDKLVSLAEALGAIPCENPEQGPWGKNIHLDVAELVEKTAKKAGIDISPPDIDGGLLKVRARQALFHERDVNAIYTAWRMREILSREQETYSICEIGAGSGRVAYWSSRLGATTYTCVDLAHINVIQSFYLLKSLPYMPISLYGEPTPVNGPFIKIVPNTAFNEVAGPVNLVLNQDSFPEINEQTVLEYLRGMKDIPATYFLSINHESRPMAESGPQLNVTDLVESIGGFRRLHRVPFWTRAGYVEELYEL